MVNLFGNATLMGEKLGTLGGYMTWKYGAVFALGTALWSILALSGTLAGEAARGSLDLVAAAPFGKRRIALEKLAAHLTMLWLAMAIVAVMIVISSNAFGDAQLGDPIPLTDAIGFALWVGFIAMCFGGLAFALAPVLGRAGSAGVAGLVMVGLWVGQRPRRRWSARGPEPVPLDGRTHPARRRVRLAGPRARRGRRCGLPRARRGAVHAPRPRGDGRPVAPDACPRPSSASAARRAAPSVTSCRELSRGGSASA